MMVGRLLSFWDGIFSGAMLNFQGVSSRYRDDLAILAKAEVSWRIQAKEIARFHPLMWKGFQHPDTEEFDTSLLSMTVIPIVGFWKLLPTIGGCVVTVSNISLVENKINMEVAVSKFNLFQLFLWVDSLWKPMSPIRLWKFRWQVQYTKAKEVPGLPPLSDFVMNKEVPVNSVWKMLPWNGGRAPTCSVEVKYLDDEMRIVADKDGELFVYMRPVDPRGLWHLDWLFDAQVNKKDLNIWSVVGVAGSADFGGNICWTLRTPRINPLGEGNPSSKTPIFRHPSHLPSLGREFFPVGFPLAHVVLDTPPSSGGIRSWKTSWRNFVFFNFFWDFQSLPPLCLWFPRRGSSSNSFRLLDWLITTWCWRIVGFRGLWIQIGPEPGKWRRLSLG